MELDVLARAVALRERRELFALATVVWRRSPSSGHLGSKALILSDGTMQGWLGGACAQPTVVHEALAAMSDGRSRLLLLGQPDDLGVRPDDGILKVPMACESEGAMEIYLEPVLPAPQVVIIGRSPAVFTLAELATALDWDVAVIDDGGDPADHPHPDAVRTRLDLDRPGRGAGHRHRRGHPGPLRRPGARSGAANRRRLRRPDRGRASERRPPSSCCASGASPMTSWPG